MVRFRNCNLLLSFQHEKHGNHLYLQRENNISFPKAAISNYCKDCFQVSVIPSHTKYCSIITCLGIGRIFSGSNSGFFQVATKSVFPGRTTVVNFIFFFLISFYQLKTSRKTFFYKKLIEKYQISKSRGKKPFRRPSEHVNDFLFN